MRILDTAESTELGLVERLYPEVIEASFPPAQLGRPWEGAKIPADLLLVAWDESTDEVLGCALGEIFPASDTLLLAYLAARPGGRGRGIGSALMQAVQERWVTGTTFALAELDDPRHHDADPGFGDPVARLRFYDRFGLKAIAAPYFQASLDAGYPRSYHLLLSQIPASGESLPDRAEIGERVRVFLEEYFAGCEGAASLDDPDVRWLLAAYCDELELVPLTALDRVPDPDPPSGGG